ncbi:sialate O-acetylesterase [Flavobacterium sp. 270]|jgi:sialate O-acetylesterase|uniref:Sialate O-acetylesterase domain-containing protein n=2 Tax=Flavobacterium frigidimaris TaxID=262320 RepID=A0ABX4BU62_FLAFR|nr:sialate O-acetylesterase [Flavobacterium sp. 270]OXA81098.1 hypothetical protein B0A65_04760 [Flavobacterium frigidimaris]
MFAVNAWCKISLPGFVSDGMVLQRDAKLPIWGWADSGEKITVRFQKQVKTAITGKDGKWHLNLDPVSSGGPYTIEFLGKNKIEVKNVLVGDVFLATGQSNMEFTTYSVTNSRDEILKANFPDIHFFRAALNVANQPIDTLKGDWKEVSPETVGDFSGVAYFFARELYQKKKIPIGVIVTAWGGSPIEPWIRAEDLQRFPEFQNELLNLKTGRDWHSTFIQYESDMKSFHESNLGVKNGVNLTVYNDDEWESVEFPFDLKALEIADNYGGNVWIRKRFDLNESFNSNLKSTLFLGKINGNVNLYINGNEITKSEKKEDGTYFIIPENVLQQTNNQIALKFLEIWGGNIGEMGQTVFIQNESSKMNITGNWKFNSKIEMKIPDYVSSNTTPSTIYNAMIAPLIPFAIKGVIWYQGESNVDRAKQYQTLFPALIEGWRKQWKSDFPFLFVQLAGFMEDKKEPSDYKWAALREAQQTTLKLPKTGMAVAIDLGEKNDIHPKNKQDVGKRLALAAEKVVYGNTEIVDSGPTFKSFSVDNGKIRIQFENFGSGLLLKDKYGYVRGFSIAGNDKIFKWAKGFQEGNNIILYNDEIENPTAVRYDWGNSPDGNLYNQVGLPAVPFRTDDYPLHFE